MLINFGKDVKPVRVMNAVAATQTTQNTSIVDMTEAANVGGFDSVAFLVLLNTMVSGSALTATVQDNSANSTSGMTAVTAAVASITQKNSANATVTQSSSNCGLVFTDVGGNSSNEMFLIDVKKPLLPYVRLNIAIATANAAFDGCVAFLYRGQNLPVGVDTSLGGIGVFVASS